MKKSIISTILAVFLITLIGGFLRFYKITVNPPSLTGDEISFGYAAYSVLKTGRDENGKFLPITFQSIGDYKNPLPAYLMIPSIKIFGLTDFAVRFPNALMGTITIPVFFLFLLGVFKNKKLALVGSFFLAISAWQIFYSRFAYETLTASLFVLLGIWFFIKMLDKKSLWWAAASAFFFTLTMYTAFAARLFVPFFIIGALAVSFSKLKSSWKKTLVFSLVCLVVGAPLAYVTFFQGAATRLQNVFIGNDIEFSRYILLKPFSSIADYPLLFFFWVKRYLSYFDPGFVFFNGLDATVPNPIGLGMLYLFDLPFLIAGIVSFIKNKIPHKELFIVWIFTGILPDSLTNNQKHAGRLLYLFPILFILTALGAIELYNWFKRIKSVFVKSGIIAFFSLAVILVLTHTFLIISADFPRDKGESFDEGWRETVYYVSEIKDQYKEIVIDPRRGIAAPDMISNPFLYVLFYTRYDPHTYQTERKISGGTPDNPYFHFGKYTFRYINWQKDRSEKGILFIGSPWSMPEKDLNDGELLKTIYLTNESPAFFIVSPK